MDLLKVVIVFPSLRNLRCHSGYYQVKVLFLYFTGTSTMTSTFNLSNYCINNETDKMAKLFLVCWKGQQCRYDTPRIIYPIIRGPFYLRITTDNGSQKTRHSFQTKERLQSKGFIYLQQPKVRRRRSQITPIPDTRPIYKQSPPAEG